MKTKTLLAIFAIVSIVIFAGCKKDDFVGNIGVCPVVISTVPTNGTTGVPVNQIITVTFNEKMNPATITQNSFSLQGASRVAGTILYDGSGPTFSFTPSAPLLYNTTYTGKVATSVKDNAGNALQEEYVWTFTTLGQSTVALSAKPLLGGTTTGSGTYDTGSSVAIGATASSGYTFVNWTEGANVISSNANYNLAITGNKTLVANFTENIYVYTVTLSSNPLAGGTTTGGGSYNAGTAITVGATANSGYTFANWTEGGTVVSTNASYPYTVSGNRNLVANFTENIVVYSVTLTSNPASAGTTTGGGSHNAGSSVTVAATPNSGYAFTNWTEGGTVVSTLASYNFTITGNRSLVANFSENLIVYSIVLSSNPLAGGTTTGSGSFNAGTSINIGATANSGYVFTNWTEGTTVVSTSATYNFTVTGNRALVANFTQTINAYTIALSSNPLIGGTTTGNGSFNAGTSTTVAATAKPGYVFTNWTEAGIIVSTDASYNFTVTKNRVLVANFTESFIAYTITLLSRPVLAGTTTGQGTYNSGTSVTVSAIANNGYYFDGWTEGSEVVSTDANYTFTISGNRTLAANFRLSINTHTVTVTSNPLLGGTTTGGGSYVEGTLVTVGATANAGYTFANWTEGVNVLSFEPTYSFTIAANRTLVANFTKITTTYCILLSSNPINGGTTSGGGNFIVGTTVTVGATENTGFTFLNWTENGIVVSSNASFTFILTSNRTLVANFGMMINRLSVTLASNPSAGGTTIGAGTYNAGTSVIVGASANSGYTFTNWTEGGKIVSTDANFTFTILENRNLVANFALTLITYNVALSSNPLIGGTTTGSGTYNAGASVTVGAAANSGYTFANWTDGINVVSYTANYTFTINSNRTLVANFTQNAVLHTVILTSNPLLGGTTTGAGSYNAMSSVTVGAIPNALYTFTSWTESGTVVSTNASYTFTITSNRTLVANFTLIPVYTVSLSANPLIGGTTSGSGSFNAGTSVTIGASANSGYTFTNWTEGVNVVSTNASYTFTINSNRTLVANFALTSSIYNVSLSSNPIAGGTTSGAGSYSSGNSVTIGASANSGYTFTNWTEGVNVVSTNASYTFTINSNRTLVANFTAGPVGPGIVDLGTAANYAILTKTGISTTGVTSITGDIGASPITATAITGFGLIMDASNTFSTSPGIVIGRVYAANYAAPTPANISTSISNMETAFTTANGLVTPAPVVELGSGNISGMNLAPGLYKWSTNVLISSAGVTLTGGPNDTWVLQISQDLIASSGAIVTLAGGAQAKNITWVVTGQTNLGTTVNFSGNILCKTLISLDNGAVVNGRLLAQSAVTLIGSTVIKPL